MTGYAAGAPEMESNPLGEESELTWSPNQPLSAGARQDIRQLLHRTAILFDEYGDLRFQHFADIFQQMKFPLIFAGRTSFKEMFELTEDLIELAKQETFSHNKTPLRVAALYLIYSLYFKQPFRPKTRIKLSLSEYKEMVGFVNECRLKKHWEVPFVFFKLVLDDAFQYVAISRPVGMESISSIGPRRKAGLPTGDDDSRSLQERRDPFKADRYKFLAKRIDVLHEQYTKMKAEISMKPDRGLTLISDRLPKELIGQYEPSVLKNYLMREGEGGGEEGEERSGNQLTDLAGLSIGERRKKLKYGNFDANAGLSHREKMHQKAAEQLGLKGGQGGSTKAEQKLKANDDLDEAQMEEDYRDFSKTFDRSTTSMRGVSRLGVDGPSKRRGLDQGSKPKKAGAGRPKGSKNKLNVTTASVQPSPDNEKPSGSLKIKIKLHHGQQD